LALFQIFRSSANDFIYRINGQYPFTFKSDKSNCYFEKILSNFLIVESPAILNILQNEKMEIYFNGALSEWKRLDIQDKVYLIPTGFNPLDINKLYVLLKEQDEKYHLIQT
jgi:hypothetical protein